MYDLYDTIIEILHAWVSATCVHPVACLNSYKQHHPFVENVLGVLYIFVKTIISS